MDFFYGSSSNDSQVQSFDGGNVSPITTQNFIRFYPHILDPYASSDSSISPLGPYLRSSSSSSPVPFTNSSGSRTGSSSGGGVFRSPLASIENIENPPPPQPVFRTPVKVVEEDVVVMDGILVGPKHRAKSSPLVLSTSSGSENRSPKSETCRWWEDSGTCSFGSKCRFVHEKEDLRSTAFANRNLSESQDVRSQSSGSCSYGPRGRSVTQQVQSAVATPTKAAGMVTPTIQKNLSTKDKEPPSSGSSTTSTSAIGVSDSTDWCPLDDNVEVFLPPSGEKCTSREDVDAHIQKVLYGPSARKRLPVFIALAEE